MIRHIAAWTLAFAFASEAAFAAPLIPPKRFDHAYAGPMDVREIDRDNVWQECSHDGRFEMRKDVAGCSSVREGVCTIHLAMQTKRAPVKSILRHEIAHCNGWRH